MTSSRLSSCILAAVAFSLSAGDLQSIEPGKGEKRVAVRTIGTAPGEIRDDNGLKMELGWCPPGTFISGSDRRGSSEQIDVTLTKGFWLGKYEVTQSEWKRVMKTEPWKDKRFVEEEEEVDLPKEGDSFPATFVSWEDAMQFCRKLTAQEQDGGHVPAGWEYTLPTEAEWEYACRAGTKGKFNFGDDESKLGEYAWFIGNVGGAREFHAHEVGQKKQNAWGLYDIHGNVSEWCRDWYDHRFRSGRDPEVTKRPGQYTCRVFRGGNWESRAEGCQSSYRGGCPQEGRANSVGFRVALSAVPPAGRPEDERSDTPSGDK